MAPAPSAPFEAPGSRPTTMFFVWLFLITYCPGKEWGFPVLWDGGRALQKVDGGLRFSPVLEELEPRGGGDG